MTSEERPELDLPEYRKDHDLDAENDVEVRFGVIDLIHFLVYSMQQTSGVHKVEETNASKGKALLDFQRRPTNVVARNSFNSVISLEDKIGGAIATFDAKVEQLYKLKLR